MNDRTARRGLMSKRSFISMLLAIVIVGGIAWIQRADLMLAMVKFRTEREINVGPNRPIPWEQGPAGASATDGQRPPNIILPQRTTFRK